MSFYIISLTFVFCVNLCSCDLPVHCKMEEIYSLWTFRIDSASFEPSLKNEQTTCGHGFPDQVDTTIGDKNFKFKHYNDIELILGKDYKVYDKTGMIQEGNWTTVYDEAFVVYYKQMVFTAFMKYYKNSHRDKDYSSNCDKTMVGWVIENGKEINKNWHCFFGFKSSIKNQFSPNTFLGYNNYNTNSNTEKGYAFLEMELGAISEANMKMTDYSQKDFVDEINNNTDLLWKADIYDDYKLKDNDELHIVDEFIFPNKVCMNMRLFDGNDIFIFKNTDKQEYINDVYESGVNMKVGKFLIPEFNKYINFTIDDLKSLQPIFDNMDEKHTYERVIFESYLKNGDFFLTDEQRREAYKEYKRSRGLK